MILQKINNRCGFTLIEVLIVGAIIGIALALLIPMVQIIRERDGADQVEIVDQTEEDKPDQTTPKKEVEEKL